jgi:hypothetical protein
MGMFLWASVTKTTPAITINTKATIPKIVGTAFGGKDDGEIIYLHKPSTKTITGINNIPVLIDNHSTCYKCGVPITEDDDKQVFVKVKQNESKIMCPDCVETIPQLKEKYVYVQ